MYNHGACSVKKRKKQSQSAGLESSQWWVGIKGGVNFTDPIVTNEYSVLSWTASPSEGNSEKVYKSLSGPGYQFGFILAYEFVQNVSVGIEPVLTSYKYEYEIQYEWASQENASQTVNSSLSTTNDLQYFEVPLTFRYRLADGPTKPYIQAGAYYGHLIKATRKTEETVEDNATGGGTTFDQNDYSGNVTDSYISPNWGIIAGLGLTHNLGNARLGLQVNYRVGMNNISDAKSRFSDTHFLSGIMDAQDDLKLNNLEVSMMVVIPLKFLTSKDFTPF